MGVPDPIQTKLTKGVKTRGNRHNDVKPLIKVPPRPRQLKGAARTEWERITPLLQRENLIAEIDRSMLTAYCIQFEIMMRSYDDVQGRGVTIDVLTREKIKVPKRNPSVGTLDQAICRLQPLAREFGMSPSARTRIRIDGANESQGSLMDAWDKRADELNLKIKNAS